MILSLDGEPIVWAEAIMPRHTRYDRRNPTPDPYAVHLLESSVRLLQDYYQHQPPERQAETRLRVRRLLRADRNRAQHSALWRVAKTVYGIDPEEV